MKKLICSVWFLIFSTSAVLADDTALLTEIYQKVSEQYVEPMSTEELAISALKSISVIDKRIKIANDKDRISVYANGKVLKVFNKPADADDIKAWVQLSNEVIASACKVSPKLERQDFEIVDTIMTETFNNLGNGSTYYPDSELLKKTPKKIKRYYSDRLVEDVLVVKLGSFNRFTKENLTKSLQANPDIRALILDLRGNQGGMLSEAIAITSLFLDDGIIASTRGRAPDSTEYYMAEEGDVLNDKPIVILVDGDTASSAEVMAAAFKEQGRAVLVGTNTFGKGTVQSLMSLSNGSQLALTTAYFFTPSDEKIDKKGILPDICTAKTDIKNDPEHIISKSFEACPAEPRENASIDIDAAIALINKNL